MTRWQRVLVLLLAASAIVMAAKPIEDWLSDSIRGTAWPMPELWSLNGG